ncbi:RHS repeat-associated core domain-containing protein [uncultured Rubinisphaera sp.]|uniref:RHS repeat domain-containing protein n=1 Tax=uncultured Rubinisphaera sp. TaxID=1678686 RepID=UPI0030D9CDD5
MSWNSFTADDWGNFEASNSSGETTTFTYDPVGNRLLKETESEVTTSTYDAANQLKTAEESSGTTTYTYDASGNQTSVEKPSGDITTQTWDYENRMIALEHPDNSVVTYAYTAVNQQDEYLVEKETDTATTKYLWDNQNILQEYDVSTEAQYNYAPMPYGNLISQQRDTDSSYYHYDGNFSTSALTDTSATETDTYNYTAWGEETSGTGATENPFTWKGEIGYYQDEDNLQLLRNRRYSAGQGRIISEDPIGLESGESNFYAYVGNNPVNKRDPIGMAPSPSLSENAAGTRLCLSKYYVFKTFVVICVRIGNVTIVCANLVYRLSVFEYYLQAVFNFPIAATFERHVDPFVAVRASCEHRLVSKPHMLPNIARRFYVDVLVIFWVVVALASFVVLVNVRCSILKDGRGSLQKVMDGPVEILLVSIIIVAFDDDTTILAKNWKVNRFAVIPVEFAIFGDWPNTGDIHESTTKFVVGKTSRSGTAYRQRHSDCELKVVVTSIIQTRSV